MYSSITRVVNNYNIRTESEFFFQYPNRNKISIPHIPSVHTCHKLIAFISVLFIFARRWLSCKILIFHIYTVYIYIVILSHDIDESHVIIARVYFTRQRIDHFGDKSLQAAITSYSTDKANLQREGLIQETKDEH